MIWVKGRGGSLEIAKPPPQNHTHTHTHVHTHAHAEPPPPQRWFWDGGGGIKTFVSDRVPTPTHPMGSERRWGGGHLLLFLLFLNPPSGFFGWGGQLDDLLL